MKKADSDEFLWHPENRDLFCREIEQTSCLLIQTIERYLRRFNLINHEPYEILSEVYIRGVQVLNQGEEIRNPSAFIKAVAYNVIRELSRKNCQQIAREKVLLDSQGSLENENSSFLDRNDLDDRYSRLQEAWESLKSKEREILKLKILENLSWHQISQRLGRKEVALRQQGSRALKHLRNAYSSRCVD